MWWIDASVATYIDRPCSSCRFEYNLELEIDDRSTHSHSTHSENTNGKSQISKTRRIKKNAKRYFQSEHCFSRGNTRKSQWRSPHLRAWHRCCPPPRECTSHRMNFVNETFDVLRACYCAVNHESEVYMFLSMQKGRIYIFHSPQHTITRTHESGSHFKLAQLFDIIVSESLNGCVSAWCVRMVDALFVD